jgi:phosphoribosyl 1,2-cyclic phosphodiesterase
MRIRFWGTRGSLPTPGPVTARYGGNTSCVEVAGARADHVIVLDAGSGIRELGVTLSPTVARVDLLLTHLHMDHIIGLGFFDALFRPGLEVHVWGPSSTTMSLHERLTRYLSPPLFPVRLRDLPCQLNLHDVRLGAFELPDVQVTAALVCHPGPTVGYRLNDGRSAIAYLPDHEPALGAREFPGSPEWTSGYDLAAGVDVLIHDAQYDAAEYEAHVGWGHSALPHTLAFAELAHVRHLVPFHHDPSHGDDQLDTLYHPLTGGFPGLAVTPAREGAVIDLGRLVRAG